VSDKPVNQILLTSKANGKDCPKIKNLYREGEEGAQRNKEVRFISNSFARLLRLCGKVFILSSLLFLNISCSTIYPVSNISGVPVTFASVEVIKPEWQTYTDGVDYFHGKTDSPKLEFWALRVDLTSPQIRIVVKDGMASNSAETSAHFESAAKISLSAKVTTFARKNNLIAGINATPFDIISLRENQPIQNIGIVISDGKILAPANPRYDAIVFYKDREQVKAAIVNQSALQSFSTNFPAENIENAVGGFHQILAGGEPTERTLTATNFPAKITEAYQEGQTIQEQSGEVEIPVSAARHPRSAAGISTDGSSLYLLVIDGRRAGSVGATERETALLLLALGSWDGLNFDGGGSTALALRGRNGKVRTVNIPVQKGVVGVERAVAGCIGVKVYKDHQ